MIPLTGDLARMTEVCWQALVEYANRDPSSPRVCTRGSVLVRMDPDDGLAPITRDRLRLELSHAAEFTRTTSRGTAGAYPPKEVVESLLALSRAEYVGAPQVSRVTEVPIFDEDGTAIFEPGLYPSGIWYQPQDGLLDVSRHVRDHDFVDDVKEARDLLLNDLLGEFDFQDEPSRANALGLVLLSFVREFIGDSPTPLHVITAPQAGSGKSYLAQAALIPGCGLPDMSAEPRNDDELRKGITARLLSGTPALIFDNLSQELNSPVLAAALTMPKWSDRVLGRSEEVATSNRLIWVATGNNVTTSDELRDRVCPIWLEPRDGTPARRRGVGTFRHSDLHGWAQANRARLAGACITLVQHWLTGQARLLPDGTFARDDQGRHPSDATMGSFERWASVIGGILAAADVRGFLANRHRLETIDYGEQETIAFYNAIREWAPTITGLPSTARPGEFRKKDLERACLLDGPLHDLLPSGVSGRDLGRSVQEWLKQHKDATHGELTLRIRTDTAGGLGHWWIEDRS
jgi:putative DNA primase/helicase